VVLEVSGVVLDEEGVVAEEGPSNFGRLVVGDDGGC